MKEIRSGFLVLVVFFIELPFYLFCCRCDFYRGFPIGRKASNILTRPHRWSTVMCCCNSGYTKVTHVYLVFEGRPIFSMELIKEERTGGMEMGI